MEEELPTEENEALSEAEPEAELEPEAEPTPEPEAEPEPEPLKADALFAKQERKLPRKAVSFLKYRAITLQGRRCNIPL